MGRITNYQNEGLPWPSFGTKALYGSISPYEYDFLRIRADRDAIAWRCGQAYILECPIFIFSVFVLTIFSRIVFLSLSTSTLVLTSKVVHT